MMRPARAVRWWGIVALGFGVAACETARNPQGGLRDRIPPATTVTPTADTDQIPAGFRFRGPARGRCPLARNVVGNETVGGGRSFPGVCTFTVMVFENARRPPAS